MAEIKNSLLLTKIMERAEKLSRENNCGGLTRDYIVVAAIAVLDETPADRGEEYERTRQLLAGFSRDGDLVDDVLGKWRSGDTANEMILLVMKNSRLQQEARQADPARRAVRSPACVGGGTCSCARSK